MYSVQLTIPAQKQLEKLECPVQERILKTLERIRIRPHSFVKKLVGESAYRLRVGDYRVIMDIQNQTLTILVIKIGHRKNIYDKH